MLMIHKSKAVSLKMHKIDKQGQKWIKKKRAELI